MRVRTLVAALLGAGVCTAASADPVSIGVFIANATLTASSVLTLTQVVALTQIAFFAVTAAVGSSIANSAKRKAENKARAAYNASVQDRQITFKSAIAPRPIIYGRQLVGGAIVFATTTGTRSEFLHLVIAISGRQIDAIEQIWFGDEVLPAPDANGFIQSGPFSDPNPVSEVATGSSTSFTVAFPPTSVQSVSRERATLDPQVQPAGFSFAGTTITITDGLHQAGDVYHVNYTRTLVSPRVRVRLYTGAPGQVADPDLIAETGGLWTSAHVGNGIAYAYFRLEYDQDVFGQTGLPDIRFLVRGFRCLDPRTSTTVWTQNAALCTADYLRDGNLGMGAAAGEVPSAELIAAANVCDEEVILYSTGTISVTNGSATVTGSGTAWTGRARPGMLIRLPNSTSGTIAAVASDTSLTLTANYGGATIGGQAYSLRQLRYQINGVLSSEAQPPDNLAELAASMAGSVVWVQGRWLVRAGAGRLPEMTLTESDLAGSEIVVQPRASRASLFNAVTGTFADRSQRYAESQYPAVANATYQTQDGGTRITRQIQYSLTDDATACQRLAKIALERARQAMVVKITTNLRAYDLVPTDWVALTLSRYGWTAKNFEVLERTWQGGQIQYTLRETAAAVYDWALGEQTTVDLAPNTTLPNPYATIPAITGLSVASGTAQLRVLNDGTIVTQGLVSWTAVTDVFVLRGGRIEIDWKLDNEVNWQAAPPEPGDATTAIIGPLDDRRITLVRVRPVNSLGRTGAWTTIAHAVVGKSAAPSNVTGLTATVIAGAVRINWTRCPDGDYQTTELRRGASWAAGVRLDTGAAGSLDISGTGYDWAWPAIGSYTILARHRDTSGNLSAATASLAITVTASGISIDGSSLIGASASGPGTNSISNPGFAVSAEGWAVVEGDAGAWARSAYGAAAALFAPAGVNSAIGWRSLRVRPGQQLRYRLRVGRTSGGAGRCFVRMQEAGSSAVGLGWVGVPGGGSAADVVLRSGATELHNVDILTIAGAPAWDGGTVFDGVYTVPAGVSYISPSVYSWLTVAGQSLIVLEYSLWELANTNDLAPDSATTVLTAQNTSGPTATQLGAGTLVVDICSAAYTNDTGGPVDVEVTTSSTGASWQQTATVSTAAIEVRVVSTTTGTVTTIQDDILTRPQNQMRPSTLAITYLNIAAGDTVTVTKRFRLVVSSGDGSISSLAHFLRLTVVKR